MAVALRDTVAERECAVGARFVVAVRDIVCARVGVDVARETVAVCFVGELRVVKFDVVRAVTAFVISGVLDITFPEREAVVPRSRTVFCVVGIDTARETVVGALLFVSYAVFLRAADTVVWEFCRVVARAISPASSATAA